MLRLQDDVLAIFRERKGERITVAQMRTAAAERIINRHPRLAWLIGREHFIPSYDQVHDAMHALKDGHRVRSYPHQHCAEWVMH